MIAINQERYWKNDTNYEHFIIMDYADGKYKIEYITNGRIQEKSEEELEEGTVLVESSSFKYDSCKEIVKYITGRRWLYSNRCKTCQWKNDRCNYL